MSSLPYGDPTKAEHIMGPLISASAKARKLATSRPASPKGPPPCSVEAPEHLPKWYYVEPTVLVDVDPNATVAQEEIFGPVLVVLPHDGDDDAVAVANNSAYGLSGAVFAGTIEHAKAVASRIRTGTLSLNNGLWYGPDVPFGGYKQSGLGREMGRAGFEEYLETKSLAEPA
ncbi:MAG: aldehyde dehydrogenase family protein [Acidimicrobiales bacterium]